MNKMLKLYLLLATTVAIADTRFIILFKDDKPVVPINQNTKMVRRLSLPMHPLNAETKQKIIDDIQKAMGKLKDKNIKLSDILPFLNNGRILSVNKNFTDKQKEDIIKFVKDSIKTISIFEEDKIMRAVMVDDKETILANAYQYDMFKEITIPGASQSYYGDTFYTQYTNAINRNKEYGANVTVAVIDTGYTPHPNFKSHLIGTTDDSGKFISGYQFITDCRISGDCAMNTVGKTTQDPAANGLDKGDGFTAYDINNKDVDPSFREMCTGESTPTFEKNMKASWHGTHVIGTIIGQGTSDINSKYDGILGGAPNATIVPVRALGKCGGRSSDIINAMYWAADLLPSIRNPNKASVINMSLGGGYPCSMFGFAYQKAINEIKAAGVTIVVAAGNSKQNLAGSTPAGCRNIISVGAVGPENKLAYYSNYGETTINAAGGDRQKDEINGGILSTIYNNPNSLYNYHECSSFDTKECYGYTYYQGTSMAAPHVTAAIADLLSIDPTLTYDQIIKILQTTGTKFDNCYKDHCVTNIRMDVMSALQSINH